MFGSLRKKKESLTNIVILLKCLRCYFYKFSIETGDTELSGFYGLQRVFF